MKSFIKTAGYFAFGIASCTIMACTAEEIASARNEALTPPPLVAEAVAADAAAETATPETKVATLTEAKDAPACKTAKAKRGTKVAARKGAKKGASRRNKGGKRAKASPENT